MMADPPSLAFPAPVPLSSSSSISSSISSSTTSSISTANAIEGNATNNPAQSQSQAQTQAQAQSASASAFSGSTLQSSDVSSISVSGVAGCSTRMHCEYVFLSEFDILKGSQCRYQFPQATGMKDSFLAESMLPEGAHLRESDWTVFFLSRSQIAPNQQTNTDSLPATLNSAAASATDEGGNVSTAANTTASASGFNANISINGSASTTVPTSSSSGAAVSADLLCVLNLVRTKHDKNVKRGAIVKALAIVTPHRWYHVFKPLLLLALDSYLDTKDDEEDKRKAILAQLYQQINSLDLTAVVQPTEQEMRVMRAIRLRAVNQTAHQQREESEKQLIPQPNSSILSAEFVNMNLRWNSTVIPLRIPLFMEDDEVLEASLSSLVSRFGENILHIYTALLCEKRIMFLGYQQPALDVCTFVLSSLLLISPPVSGTLSRAFPYANLMNLNFLEVSGYVAGTTNPLFAEKDDYWDLLCNIRDGTVTFSKCAAAGSSMSYQEEINTNSEREKQSMVDSAFYQELINGIRMKYGEEWIRCAFRDFTCALLALSLDNDRDRDSLGTDKADRHVQSSQWQLMANQLRVNGFLRSKTFEDYERREKRREKDSPWREMDAVIRFHLRTLKHKESCSSMELLAIFNDLVHNVRSREEVLELLSLLNESHGGLFPIASALFHKHPKVRSSALLLMSRIDREPEGSKAVSSLNYFLLMTYYRARHVRAANLAGADNEDGIVMDERKTVLDRDTEQQRAAEEVVEGIKSEPVSPKSSGSPPHPPPLTHLQSDVQRSTGEDGNIHPASGSFDESITFHES